MTAGWNIRFLRSRCRQRGPDARCSDCNGQWLYDMDLLFHIPSTATDCNLFEVDYNGGSKFLGFNESNNDNDPSQPGHRYIGR
jgi:hypothetical protein